MKNNAFLPVVAMALTFVAACDYADKKDIRDERSDGLYSAAMGDFRSGRIDAAIKGFEAAIRKDPANASARFQLACVLQDSKHDYLGAFCGYREYIMQHPESDKAKLAADRMESCEGELAKKLSAKYGLVSGEGTSKELEMLRGELKSAKASAAMVSKDLSTANVRIQALLAERARLMAMIKGTSTENRSSSAPSFKEAKDLLEEDEDDIDKSKMLKEAEALKKDADEDGVDRIKMSKDIKALKMEEPNEVSAGASILPVHTAEDVARRDAAKAAREAAAKEKAAEADGRPKTYMVQEGDTLLKVAKRFYGSASAWKQIRDANKELIPMDGRLRAGDTIRLP